MANGICWITKVIKLTAYAALLWWNNRPFGKHFAKMPELWPVLTQRD